MKMIVEDHISHHREFGFALHFPHDSEQKFFAQWRLEKRGALVTDGSDKNWGTIVWVTTNIAHGVKFVGLSGSLRQPDLPSGYKIPRNQHPLNLARSLVNLRDARIAIVSLNRVVFEISIAAVNLDRFRADPLGQFRRI